MTHRLVSKRHDVSRFATEELTWDFYDSFHKNNQTKLAIKNGEASFDGKNLEKYLVLATGKRKKNALELLLESNNKKKVDLPSPFEELVKLQTYNGKWEDLNGVLRVLQMPTWARVIIQGNEASIWEQATALAVAFMRQHYHMFDVLQKYHDKGANWFSSNEVLYAARELLNSYHQFEEAVQPKSVKDDDDESVKRAGAFFISDDVSTSSVETSSNDLLTMDDIKYAMPQEVKTKLSVLTVSSAKKVGFKGVASNTETVRAPIEEVSALPHSADVVATPPVSPSNDIAAVPEARLSPPVSSPIQSPHVSSPVILSPDMLRPDDTDKINKLIKELKEKVLALQLEAVELCLAIEKKVSDIKKIKEKSVDYFNNCGTYAERNSAFDELTANLGDNVAPKEGFAPDDWRFIGVQGLRPLMVKFFCKIQAIAEERLDLEELEKRPKYGARALKAERIVDGNRGRWGLVWNGEDIVEKITHSMDFLRKCKEFCNWYGRRFYFLGNPLMLPFDMLTAHKELNMEFKVKEQLDTRPFQRVGTAVKGGTSTWQHEKYLTHWYKQFEALYAEKTQFNWPVYNVVKETEEIAPLYTAMLAIYIRAHDNVSVTVGYEKRFISLASTLRGQSLMEGKTGLKAEKQLTLPVGYIMPLDIDGPEPPLPLPVPVVAVVAPVVEVVVEEPKGINIGGLSLKELLLGTQDAAPVAVEKEDSVEIKKKKPKKKKKSKASDLDGDEAEERPKSKPSTPATGPLERVKTSTSRPTTASKAQPASNTTKESSVTSPLDVTKGVEKSRFGRGAKIKGPVIAELGPTKEVLASMSTSKVSRIALSSVKLTKRVVLPSRKEENAFFRLRSESPPSAQKLAAPVLLAPLKLAGKLKK